jgi:glycerophosphoryl diester phosphodiesterase
MIKTGHRGARAWLPENTIESCLKAIEMGMDCIEIDISISKDLQIVVSHDPWMQSHLCSFPDGRPVLKKDEKSLCLYKMDIKKFDCGIRANPKFPDQKGIKTYKPLLGELVVKMIEYCKEMNLKLPLLNIEVKSRKDWDNKKTPNPQQFVDILMQKTKELQDLYPSFEYYLSSFDTRVLQIIKAQYPKIQLGFLVYNLRSLKHNLSTLGFIPDIYSPYYLYLSIKTIQKCHDLNIKVIIWTVNDKAQINKFTKLGVDGIITDYPDLLTT